MKSRFGLFCLLLLSFWAGGCALRPQEPLWDLPSIIGQPMELARKTLGQPQSEVVTAPGTMKSVWQRDGVTLSASWKSGNGRITELQLISRQDSTALREGETDQLLFAGQLQENDLAYRTQWIESASKPLFYTGVKILPAPKNHAVVIRVSGSQALLQVAYAAGAKSEELMTIAPWETSFILPDDAKISLAAQIYKRLNREPFSMKVEILADGKVVASDSSTGRAISCSAEL